MQCREFAGKKSAALTDVGHGSTHATTPLSPMPSVHRAGVVAQGPLLTLNHQHRLPYILLIRDQFGLKLDVFLKELVVMLKYGLRSDILVVYKHDAPSSVCSHRRIGVVHQ